MNANPAYAAAYPSAPAPAIDHAAFAATGDVGHDPIDAWFDLAVRLSTRCGGEGGDLIEAHKWFNLAASTGHGESARCRADLSHEMSRSDVAEAQRRARAWLRNMQRAAA